MQSLQDVLKDFAKSLTVKIPVENLKEQLINHLNDLFGQHSGNYNVTFELLELEKVKRFVRRDVEINDNVSADTIEETTEDEDNIDIIATDLLVESQLEEVEELVIKNKLEMPSRKLKINISKELLTELESLQVDFRLN